MKTVTYFGTLCRLAREEYLASKSGDKSKYEEAKKRHEEYRKLCLESDEVII